MRYVNSLFILIIIIDMVFIVTKIFFSKTMYSQVCIKWGEFVKSLVTSERAKQPHLLLLQVKLDYIPNILPQTGCPAKFAFRLQRGTKWAKSAIFAIFPGFSYIPAELFIVEENFCLLKCRDRQAASLPCFGISLR